MYVTTKTVFWLFFSVSNLETVDIPRIIQRRQRFPSCAKQPERRLEMNTNKP
jgi:hypothetical protein